MGEGRGFAAPPGLEGGSRSRGAPFCRLPSSSPSQNGVRLVCSPAPHGTRGSRGLLHADALRGCRRPAPSGLRGGGGPSPMFPAQIPECGAAEIRAGGRCRRLREAEEPNQSKTKQTKSVPEYFSSPRIFVRLVFGCGPSGQKRLREAETPPPSFALPRVDV